MELSKWLGIFQQKTMNLKPGDFWQLQFDNFLVPNFPNSGWQQYIRSTSARFRCSRCGRSWPSNQVSIVFHMCLVNGRGTVKVKRYNQNCKTCTAAPMEEPNITDENIHILLENLVKKIKVKCYHEQLERADRPFVNIVVKSPHEPSHCEGCIAGICSK
ncbi:receptor-transporting protein 2-like [Antennarius striatus]|uniref:receptor-transporting protein 2-like n=1 Tax=Antennarius striatus TaxID=241820 RepID=UPI0035B4B722